MSIKTKAKEKKKNTPGKQHSDPLCFSLPRNEKQC